MISSASQLSAALAAHQAGNLPQAETLYRGILENEPNHADTLHLLGVLLHQCGDAERALDLIQQAIQARPGVSNFHNSLGNVRISLGQDAQALESFRQTIVLSPTQPDGYLNAGLVLESMGKAEEALQYYQTALQLNPHLPEGYNNLGSALLALHRFEEAANSLNKALALDPGFYKAHYNLCLLNEQQRRLDQAVQYCQQALALAPDFAEGFEKLGSLYYQQGNHSAAKSAYREALALNPTDTVAAQNLGTVCLALDHIPEAMDSFQKVLNLEPDNPEALYGLGAALVNLNRMEEAIACYEKAFTLHDSDARRVKLAMFFPFLYPSNEAIATWRERLKAHLTALEQRPLAIENPVLTVGRTPFYLPYQGFNDREVQQAFARILGPCVPQVHKTRFEKNTKPRIGFISKYFRKKHTIGKVMEGIIQHLNRDEFEVYLLMMDNGGLSKSDPIQTQPQDHLIELPLWDTAQATQQVADLNLDILVYTDIGMEPSTYFMGFSRLAPIQCVTWGHPITTGLPEMDYYLSCRDFEIETCQDHYSETVVLLETIPTYYRRPSLGDIPKSRNELGLSPADHIYLCPQSLYKIHPDFDPLLGEILRRDPKGKALFFDGLHPVLNQELVKRWEQTIPDVLSQIKFIGRVDATTFYNYLTQADVMLDPVHFGGGNTSLEALSFGTPIVTLPRDLMHGRFTYAFYKKMGVMDCVASTPQEYIDIALRLGQDPAYRQQIKAQILTSNDILYENEAVVREWERFFHQVLENLPAT